MRPLPPRTAPFIASPSPAEGFDRRQALALLAAAGLTGFGTGGAQAESADADAGFVPAFGAPQPFSFDALAARARELAAQPYAPPVVAQPEVLAKIDYDAHWRIRFRPETTVGAGEVPVQFFHLGTFFRAPVAITVVQDGQAREVLYDERFFEMPEDSPAHALTEGLGFAGFRLMRPDLKTDWISFLGGAYFRTDGALRQYGQSARGIALNSGMSIPEEFPRFSEFHLEVPPAGTTVAGRPADVIIHALMDGPSVAGAYRMVTANTEGAGQVMEITARLFFRQPVERVGIGPLTSMYWYSETNRLVGFDWRPEIHDTDGLMMVMGSGEQVWRPLNNPPRVVTSSYVTENPRGFGLVQRDRAFENYQDDGVFYDRRPSVWIEPLGDWGPGQVQLVEIPTDDEIYDNIVAFWNPASPPAAGAEHEFRYNLHWLDRVPQTNALARTVATRIGAGGVPGQPRPPGHLKVAIDFEGPAVKGLGQNDRVTPEVSLPAGVTLEQAYALPVVGTDRWRLIFDISAEGVETADIRAYLSRDGAPLTETWLGQIHPRQFDRARGIAP
ncbi:glucan biosynthesis protein D [Frigidibacter sp. MR17.14]|uniref:glucan biosynthesis protein n=1 Tax=Frigidibacter sp. MR17.14 TaxID=3126509 RepID=UPI003012D6F0